MTYPESTWAKLRTDYETGDYSMPKLGEKYSISEQAIWKKRERDSKRGVEWVKGKNAAIIQQTIADRNIAAFINAGCTHQTVVGRMADKLLNDDGVLPYVQEYNKMCGGYAPIKKEDVNPLPNVNLNIDAKNIQNQSPADIAKYYSELLRGATGR